MNPTKEQIILYGENFQTSKTYYDIMYICRKMYVNTYLSTFMYVFVTFTVKLQNCLTVYAT